MDKTVGKTVLIVILLTAIWAIVKFGNGLLTIPLWIIIIALTKFNSAQLTSVLIVSEFFIGVDTFTIGPFSIIQILGVIILLRNIKTIKKDDIVNPLFAILLVLFLYFSYSYYSYYKELTFAPINWIFIYLLTILSFKGEKSELYFVGWLTVLSITLVILVNLVVHISSGIVAVKTFAFGNPNQIGFFGLYALVYIIYLYGTNEKGNVKLLMLLFYINAFYIIFTGSRLNTLILILFITIIGLSPVKGFWIKKKAFLLTAAILVTLIVFSGGIGKFIFRNNENVSLKDFSITRIEDLNDPYLASFTNARSRVYYDAINSIKREPIFGKGFLSWNDRGNTSNTIVTGKNGSRISMHSTILQYLAETGIFGLIFYLSYLYIIFRDGRALMKGSHTPDLYFAGQLIIWISILMFLGGTLDNHSLSYAQIHFIGAISVIMRSKVNEEQAFYEEYSVLHK